MESKRDTEDRFFDVEMFWYGVSNKNNVIYKQCQMSVMIGP